MEWWQTFFDEWWEAAGFGSIAPERTEAEVDFLTTALRLTPESRVLDVPCGIGRHSLALARRGFRRVLGIDLTPRYIARAQVEAHASMLPVEFRTGDMRKLDCEGEFDAVLNMWTSLGYFADENEDLRAVQAFARALKPGGRLCVQIMNRDWLLKNFAPRGWTYANAVYLLEEREFDPATSRIRNRWTYVNCGDRAERCFDLRVYSLHELRALITRAGLALEAAHGGIAGEPATVDSRMLLVIGIKP